MTIKIKAPRDVAYFPDAGREIACRIVSESDWRKLMKLVKVVEDFNGNPDALWDDVESALRVLRGKGA